MTTLTHREVEIQDLLAKGLQNKEIAFQLGVAENTIKCQVRGLYKKLGVRNRTQAAKSSGKLAVRRSMSKRDRQLLAFQILAKLTIHATPEKLADVIGVMEDWDSEE